MTLGELISLARLKLDDRVAPYLWSDADLTDFANAAQTEACDRARFLMTSENIPVVTGDTSVTTTITPAHVMDLSLTTTDGQLLYPEMVSRRDFSLGKRSVLILGAPVVMAHGNLPNELFIHPGIPKDGTLTVEFSRLPTEDEQMTSSSDEPVVPLQHQRQLVHWMLYEAFSVRDADGRDDKRASAAEQNFTKAFGPRMSAKLYTHERRTLLGGRMYPRSLGS